MCISRLIPSATAAYDTLHYATWGSSRSNSNLLACCTTRHHLGQQQLLPLLQQLLLLLLCYLPRLSPFLLLFLLTVFRLNRQKHAQKDT